MNLSCFAAVLAAAIPLSSTASTPGAGHLAAAAEAIYQRSGAVSAVVTVVTSEGTQSYTFGPVAPGSKMRADDRSLLRINSTSKLLTAHVALTMATEGRLLLDAPYGPQAPMTLRQLITHTSGMPRSPDLEYPANAAPHTWPTQQVRSQWLATQKLGGAPGNAALYSNVGYDLLADALARAGGKPYPVLLRERITGPLQMHDTTSSPSAEQCQRLLQGASDEGACADTSATAGTGGVYSTPRDMAIWMRYMLGLHPRHKPARGALDTLVPRTALASVTGLDKGGHADGIGYGWIAMAPTASRPALMQKTGGGAGFMSYMVLAPGEKIGAFVAVTRVDMPMMEQVVEQTLTLVGDIAAQRRTLKPAGPASRP